jgi:hypothetical protein
MLKVDSNILGILLVLTLLIVYGAIAANAGSFAALAFLAKTVFIIIFAFAHLYAYDLIKKGFSKLMN